jgi:hypothetical protein
MKSKFWQVLTHSFLLGSLIYPLVVQVNLTSAQATPFKFRLPKPPARGIAGNRTAAASRDKCPEVSHPLTALVPKYSSDRVWGLTTMERPTFWVYLPYPKESIVDISFTLQDESNPAQTQTIYQNNKLTPPSKPGLMRIDLPKSTTALTPNKPYHWFVTLNMGCTLGQRPIFVDGWVERQNLEPEVRDRLNQASLKGKVNLYADNGFWYDALTTLAALRAAQPQDNSIKQDWKNLLNTIDLGSLADRSLSLERRSDPSKPLKRKGF